MTEEQIRAFEALIELAASHDRELYDEFGGMVPYVEREEITTARRVLAVEQYELVDVSHAGIDATLPVEGLS